MPRAPRLLLSQSYYHVMTRGNNLNTIFRQNDDYLKYLEIILDLKKSHPFEMYHYCLMPNHTHYLIKTNKESDFSTFMKRLNLIYFYYFKKNTDGLDISGRIDLNLNLSAKMLTLSNVESILN